MCEKFGKHGLAKPKPTVRSLTTPFRMNEGMEEEAPKKKVEPVDGPLLTERDKLKIERRKRKDERQREVTKFSEFFILVSLLYTSPSLPWFDRLSQGYIYVACTCFLHNCAALLICVFSF